MKNFDLTIIGGGGHAKSIISTCRNIDHISVKGYTDILDKGIIQGIPWLGFEKEINLENECVAIGLVYEKSPLDRKLRESIIDYLKLTGCIFPSIVSSNSLICSSSQIDRGTMVLNNAVVNSDCQIGEFCSINSSAVVEHDVKIGIDCHIGPNATVCGGVTINDNCFIGAGAVLIDDIEIGRNTIIGAGSTVVKNIGENQIWVGNPAKRIK
jgi:sugar O-acyltransferase (sialic acid O-acetyltransferase NeuD family)